MLTFDAVGFAYPGEAPLFDDVSMRVAGGEVVGLVGPSGCGKTTLGKLACGMLQPTRGAVSVDGSPVSSATGPRPVQLVAQDPFAAMNPRWRIEDVLAEAGGLGNHDVAPAGLIDPAWLDRYPHEISGGELQRVNLVRALRAGPAFLVADEISASLDPITQAELWTELLDTVGGSAVGVLAISHDRELLDEVSDRVVELTALGQESFEPTAGR